MSDNTIFIMIASYRDFELVKTIDDCLEKADNPDNLFFGVCLQRDKNTEKEIEKYFENNNIKFLDIDFRETLGACWARKQAQGFYNNEKYYFQLDSHHRFKKNWDTILINMLEELKNKEKDIPILTTYLPAYNPEDDKNLFDKSTKMVYDYSTEEGIPLFKPHYFENDTPIKSKFISGHFIFTYGSFIKDVPYDEELYFHGEEIDLSIRAFLKGYVFFHPHIAICWHEYTRNYRPKQWNDDTEWQKKDKKSKDKVSSLLKNGYNNDIKTFDEYLVYSELKEVLYEKII